MMHQFGKDLSVRIRLKLVTLLGQERLDVIVVGYDAIVHHHKAVALVGAVWMRVALAGHTVGGPTGVCNAHVGEHRVAVLVPIEVCVCVRGESISKPVGCAAVAQVQVGSYVLGWHPPAP